MNKDQERTVQKSAVQTLCSLCFGFLAKLDARVEQNLLGKESFPIASAMPYEGLVKKLVYKVKYDADLLLVHDLSYFLRGAWDLLAADLSSRHVNAADVVLVPVPLHWLRRLKRGFNQSELLALQIANYLHLPVVNRALTRCRPTKVQHTLSRKERLVNIHGCFKGNHKIVQDKNLVLVDDVYTSGATLSEAARQLLRAGAATVAGLTVARALKE